jgi:hypothetical protein
VYQTHVNGLVSGLCLASFYGRESRTKGENPGDMESRYEMDTGGDTWMGKDGKTYAYTETEQQIWRAKRQS